MKKRISTKELTLLPPLLALALLGLWVPENTAFLVKIFASHPLLGPILLILWRITSIVIPPIPGGLVSLALVPVFGWFASFMYATVGVLLGCCIAFLLARRYREPLVTRFVSLQQMHEWEDKLSENSKFWAFILIRFTTGPVMDFMSYVAGLSKISFGKFFFATLITLLPDAIYYYAGDALYRKNPYLAIVGIGIFIVCFYLLEKTGVFRKKI